MSQVDTFDHKPMLLKRQGEAMTGVGEIMPFMGTPGNHGPPSRRTRGALRPDLLRWRKFRSLLGCPLGSEGQSRTPLRGDR
ncbi:MAG: hypothetical protein ACK5TZ_00290 [bacterium]